MTPEPLWIGADNYVLYEGARDSKAAVGVYLNSGTCTYTLKDSLGTAILSSQSMAYVASSNGNYRGTIDRATSVDFTDGETYVVEITFNDAGSGADDFRRLERTAEYRGEN